MPDRVIDAPIAPDLDRLEYLAKGGFLFTHKEVLPLLAHVARLEAEKQEAHTEAWISVGDRLPEGEALLFCTNSLMDYYEVGELPDSYREGDVTYWQPLPPKPTAVKQGEPS